MRVLIVVLGCALVSQIQGFLLPISPRSNSQVVTHAVERRDGACSRAEALTSVTGTAAALGLLGGPLTFLPKIASAEVAAGQTYVDDKYKVSFAGIPSEWQRTDTRVGAGNDPSDFRKLVVFKDPKSEANIFVAYTPVQPDFATLGSFGSILDVAKTIVPTGRGVKSRLLKYETRKGYYVFDYTIQPDRQPMRHLMTIFALIPGECLVTYTASSLEDHYPEWEETFIKVTESFKIGA